MKKYRCVIKGNFLEAIESVKSHGASDFTLSKESKLGTLLDVLITHSNIVNWYDEHGILAENAKYPIGTLLFYTEIP